MSCLCGCGRETAVASRNRLDRGHIQGQPIPFVHGHNRRGRGIDTVIHGHAGPVESRTYVSWRSMRERCSNESAANYADYGGRGISICDEWSTFAQFLADMGERPEGKTLDRIDNDGNYEPNNCRWATPLEQRHNQRPRVAHR